MARRRIEPVFAEILEALNGIESHTVGLAFVDFQQNWLLKLAVQRALEIVSEASRHYLTTCWKSLRKCHGNRYVESAIFCATNTTRSLMTLFGQSSWNMWRPSETLLRLFIAPSKVKTDDFINALSQMSHPAIALLLFPLCGAITTGGSQEADYERRDHYPL